MLSHRYPAWKFVVLLIVFVISTLYSMPNLYGEDPAVQVSLKQEHSMNEDSFTHIQDVLKKAELTPTSASSDEQTGALLRFKDTVEQLKARDVLREDLGSKAIVALNLAARTPAWLAALGASPMKLGLDLRGGVHFLMDVDTPSVIAAKAQGDIRSIQTEMREHKVRYTGIRRTPPFGIEIHCRNEACMDGARQNMTKSFPEYILDREHRDEQLTLYYRIQQKTIDTMTDYAIDQTMSILRKRVNELGVSEAIVQRQGRHHISIDLPGVQDTARAKDLLGKTATLRFQLVDGDHDLEQALNGNLPLGSRIYYDKEGARPFLLKERTILKGTAITYATGAMRNGRAAVNIHLGGGGEALFHKVTAHNIGQALAVVYTETIVEGKQHKKHEYVISAPTIQSALGNNFDITGLSSQKEAMNLALLLRSGALSAPVSIIEELTVGPSMGKANIHKGILSLEIGSLLVFLFMALYYRRFGMVANLALVFNMLLIVAILSILGATLTLPGIAGIVLTVGMAVDANVLINERIREELRAGMTPLAAISAGYEQAFATIVDANVTTLIVAVVLFCLGSGSVKGFAITLIIGLLASMLTAVTFTRGIVELMFARKKRLKGLPIGI